MFKKLKIAFRWWDVFPVMMTKILSSTWQFRVSPVSVSMSFREPSSSWRISCSPFPQTPATSPPSRSLLDRFTMHLEGKGFTDDISFARYLTFFFFPPVDSFAAVLWRQVFVGKLTPTQAHHHHLGQNIRETPGTPWTPGKTLNTWKHLEYIDTHWIPGNTWKHIRITCIDLKPDRPSSFCADGRLLLFHFSSSFFWIASSLSSRNAFSFPANVQI